jgi:hypothetical protein
MNNPGPGYFKYHVGIGSLTQVACSAVAFIGHPNPVPANPDRPR